MSISTPRQRDPRPVDALRDIVLFWADEGVRIFRVDNPHTKPLPFWEWLIAEVRSRHPDVIFLSEAFTRPKMMYRLAKIGFSQSYTYFTWRNTKQELTDYFVELTTTGGQGIFPPALVRQHARHQSVSSCRPRAGPAFSFAPRWRRRCPACGACIPVSSFARRRALPGREEYLNSEKYEIRVARLRRARQHHRRDLQAQPHPQGAIRRCRRHLGLALLPRAQRSVILYGKPLPADGDMILVAVSLDPFHAQEATIEVPLWEWQLPDDALVDGRRPDARHDFVLARQAAARPPRSGRASVRDLAHRAASGG